MNENKFLSKKMIILYAAVAIFILLLAIFNQYAIVYTKKNDSHSSSTIIRYKKPVSSNWTQIGFGLKIINKDNYIFEAFDGKKISRKSESLKSFWINIVELKLIEQKRVFKIASDTKNCVYGNKEEIFASGNVYSYDCPIFSQIALSNPSNLFTYPLGNDFGLKLTTPYKDGVVGIKEVKKADDESATIDTRIHLVYINKTQSRDIFINGMSFIDGYVELSKDDNRVFIYNSKDEKLAVINNISATPVVKVYNLKNPGSSYRLATMYASEWGLYLGWIKLVDIERAEGVVESVIQRYEVTNSPLLKEEFKTSDKKIINNYLGSFTVINNNQIAATSAEDSLSIVIFDLRKGRLVKKNTILNAQKIVRNKQDLYILSSDNKVFSYFPNQELLQLVFDSDLLTIQSINLIDAGLIIKGKTNQDLDSTLLLDDNKLINYPRFEDSLPYKYSVNETPYYVIDYWNNTVIVTSPPAYMLEIPINEVRKEVNSYLTKNNIDTSKIRIIYR